MEQIIEEEVKRCLNCKIPKCKEACPIHNRIPEFIEKMKDNNLEEAYGIIRSVNPLGAICGRVCPKENQCEGSCVRGIKSNSISIGKLESYVCDWAIKNKIKIKYDIKENNRKIAIIGGGPAGIACAVDLRKLGYNVTIFEKENFLGGILMYGIPEYRLRKELVTNVINDLLELGINVEYNVILKNKIENDIDTESENEMREKQKEITIDSLFSSGYEAIFIGVGAEISNILPIEGAHLLGVYGANEFLREKNELQNKKAIVIGGGNVAMDSARLAKRKGAEVTVVYRKLKENMPANRDEIEAAENEGINFVFKTNIVKICGEKYVTKVICDTQKEIETDIVVMAIGSTPNEKYLDKNLKLTEQGLIEINQEYETSIKNVFAGGDLVHKKATVCMAIKNGKEAAQSIDTKLSRK